LSQSFVVLPLDPELDSASITRLHRRDAGCTGSKKKSPLDWYRCGGPWMHPEMAREFFSELFEFGGMGLVARMNGRLVGQLEVEPMSGENVFLSNIVVDPDCRCRGIGRGMVQHLAKCLTDNCNKIVTCPVIDSYPFYSKLGFYKYDARRLIEGKCETSKPRYNWENVQILPSGLPIVIGGNQPDSHHRLTWKMRFERLFGGYGPYSILSRPEELGNNIVVGARFSKPGSSSAWLFVWGDIDIQGALKIGLDFLRGVGVRTWYSYVPDSATAQLSYTAREREPWLCLPLANC
jgi:predicted N-acetyltransferase YhbS